jgi:hypothetical protein
MTLHQAARVMSHIVRSHLATDVPPNAGPVTFAKVARHLCHGPSAGLGELAVWRGTGVKLWRRAASLPGADDVLWYPGRVGHER